LLITAFALVGLAGWSFLAYGIWHRHKEAQRREAEAAIQEARYQKLLVMRAAQRSSPGDDDWFRAAISAAGDALNRTRAMAMMATAQGEDLEARDYYRSRLYGHVNQAIVVLATLENTTLSKILEEVRKTVGSDEIFRRNVDAEIENFRRQQDDS
jgi:hypothetical protein